jgi:hypothetical protein
MKNENVAKEQMPLPTQTNALNICPFFSVRWCNSAQKLLYSFEVVGKEMVKTTTELLWKRCGSNPSKIMKAPNDPHLLGCEWSQAWNVNSSLFVDIWHVQDKEVLRAD